MPVQAGSMVMIVCLFGHQGHSQFVKKRDTRPPSYTLQHVLIYLFILIEFEKNFFFWNFFGRVIFEVNFFSLLLRLDTRSVFGGNVKSHHTLQALHTKIILQVDYFVGCWVHLIIKDEVIVWNPSGQQKVIVRNPSGQQQVIVRNPSGQ